MYDTENEQIDLYLTLKEFELKGDDFNDSCELDFLLHEGYIKKSEDEKSYLIIGSDEVDDVLLEKFYEAAQNGASIDDALKIANTHPTFYIHQFTEKGNNKLDELIDLYQ